MSYGLGCKAQKARACLFPEHVRQSAQATALLLILVQGRSDFALGAGADLGSIEPGKLADLVVLSGDYLTVPEAEIQSLRALATMVGGKLVHADLSVFK